MDKTKNTYDLATKALENKKNTYKRDLCGYVFGGIIVLIMCVPFLIKYFSWFLCIITAIILIAITNGLLLRTNEYLKCKKSYLNRNYTYHYIKIDNIRPGHFGFFIDFTINEGSYTEFVGGNTIKYMHVFECDGGAIMFTADTENLLI